MTICFVYSCVNMAEAISNDEKMREAKAERERWTAELDKAMQVLERAQTNRDTRLEGLAEERIATAKEAIANARKDIADLRSKTAAAGAGGGASGSSGGGAGLSNVH